MVGLHRVGRMPPAAQVVECLRNGGETVAVVGDAVSEGETVVVLEAMKMENALPAPATGTVKAINFASGDSVAKGDVLCVVG